MKKLFFALVLIFVVFNSCNKDEDPSSSTIIISDIQHHVGDNTGAEGLSLYAEFEMPESFSSGKLDITFVHPDEDGTSGPDVDTPPEITINGEKIGVYTNDFTQYPECISSRQFQCTKTLTYDISEALQSGTNEFRISSKAFVDNFDDFTFSDVVVRVQ